MNYNVFYIVHAIWPLSVDVSQNNKYILYWCIIFQELIAYGISTVFSSFLSSAAPSASLSRSLVQERVGGKTQVCFVLFLGNIFFCNTHHQLLHFCSTLLIFITNEVWIGVSVAEFLRAVDFKSLALSMLLVQVKLRTSVSFM